MDGYKRWLAEQRAVRLEERRKERIEERRATYYREKEEERRRIKEEEERAGNCGQLLGDLDVRTDGLLYGVMFMNMWHIGLCRELLFVSADCTCLYCMFVRILGCSKSRCCVLVSSRERNAEET